MMTFKEQKDEFLRKNKSILDVMITQLTNIDASKSKYGDHCAFGAEFIFNGLDTGSQYYNVGNFIEDQYDNISSHMFNLVNEWDSFLYFCPTDYRGLIFDFSRLCDGKIITYNGLTTHFTTDDIVTEFSIEDFLKIYGIKYLYSCTHYKVWWDYTGFSWNN